MAQSFSVMPPGGNHTGTSWKSCMAMPICLRLLAQRRRLADLLAGGKQESHQHGDDGRPVAQSE